MDMATVDCPFKGEMMQNDVATSSTADIEMSQGTKTAVKLILALQRTKLLWKLTYYALYFLHLHHIADSIFNTLLTKDDVIWTYFDLRQPQSMCAGS